jgi:hypothetical protein
MAFFAKISKKEQPHLNKGISKSQKSKKGALLSIGKDDSKKRKKTAKNRNFQHYFLKIANLKMKILYFFSKPKKKCQNS